MESYSLSKQEVLASLGSAAGGLSSAEAARRLGAVGKNVIAGGKKRGKLALFFAQFRDLMTIILICAAVLSAALSYFTSDPSEIADTAILLFIILLNAFVGFLQQYRADAAIEKLKTLSADRAKVVRDGRLISLDAKELVPGDVIELEEGDKIPADGRILESESLRCDESALTGESVSVGKRDCIVRKKGISERENTVFSSTFCVGGRARCVVTGTGMNTEMGAIARLLHESKPAPSPLDKTVEKLGKIITVTVLCVAAVLFLAGIVVRRTGFLENLMTAVAVAVAAIPEGLGAVVTVILAMGVQRMASFRAVVRKLSAVETLGSCSCICSDKTGTLTQNRMTVAGISAGCSAADRTDPAAREELLLCMRVCHSVGGERGGYLGDPTEVALVDYADRCGASRIPRLPGGIPFSSERKRMSVVGLAGAERRLFVKGGADVLLPLCTHKFGGGALTASDRESIKAQIAAYSASAMRVLAFAEGAFDGTAREEGLVYLGLVALFDPPREGAREAVFLCKKAGIRTVMITGDSAETALEIARRLGIATSRAEVLTGEEIDALGENFTQHAGRYRVFARVSPAHKLSIVRALQAEGEVVAMTGDGVNDAPSVRAADIGVAMGSGTDVTKDAADMVLSDDDFSTIVRAAEEGRNVFYNVRRTISFFLSTNFAEVLSVLFITLLMWRFEFLTSTQLLWINLITDSLPVLALGMERTHGAMEGPPVSAEDIFSRRSLCAMLFFGVAQALIVVAVFAFGVRFWGNCAASTCAFLVLSLPELFHAFNVRGEGGARRLRSAPNRLLFATVGLGIVCNGLLVLIPPLRAAFGLCALSPAQWAAVFASSLLILPVGTLYRRCVCLRARRARGSRRRGGIRTPVRGNIR